jgi:hypothetical protein
MPWRLLFLLAAAGLAAGCSSYRDATQYQNAASVTSHLDDHSFVLQHTPPGSYSYSATSPSLDKVVLSVAGVTNLDDQNAILATLRSHRFDKDRNWDELLVLFYEKVQQTPQGVAYVDLLRQEKIEP